MSTPNEPAPPAEQQQPAGGHFAYAPWPPGQLQPAGAPGVIDPNNPPWGLLAAILTWLASVALLIVMALVFLIPLAMSKAQGMTTDELRQYLATDKTAILLALLSGFPAHLLTLGIVWAVVTGFGKRPFWRTIGWTRGRGFGFWTSAGLAALLYVFSLAMIYVFGQDQTETALSRVVQSSREAALAIAFMAFLTAPLVEELVYRGVLYSALHKAAGRGWAIVGVLVLFTLIHVPQYWPQLRRHRRHRRAQRLADPGARLHRAAAPVLHHARGLQRHPGRDHHLRALYTPLAGEARPERHALLPPGTLQVLLLEKWRTRSSSSAAASAG